MPQKGERDPPPLKPLRTVVYNPLANLAFSS